MKEYLAEFPPDGDIVSLPFASPKQVACVIETPTCTTNNKIINKI